MLDAGGGGGMVGMAKSMGSLKQAAADGQFAVNETGGQALLVAIREMAKWVDTNLADLGTLAQQPALGASHGAEAMKPYVQEVATDQEGFLTMLQQFRASLEDAEAGVIGAMNNYNHIETTIEGKFRA
ncbi:hypothetical protein [Actinophytocola sp. NPDC049390]|uniref:hypothetical protein n=1 Tax=Actinophytocola sp. NPDC049390 TaxID=3363894 RepID=UPI0037B000C6